MKNVLHTLKVAPAMSSIHEYPPGREVPVAFLDLVVDERPLRTLFDIPEELAPVEFETTAFRDDWVPRAALEQLDRLLGLLPGDFEDGRVAVFLCPVDGDLWCGSVSMEVVRTPETVTWQKFGWQELGSPIEPELWLFNERSFSFDRGQYEEVLRELRDKQLDQLYSGLHYVGSRAFSPTDLAHSDPGSDLPAR